MLKLSVLLLVTPVMSLTCHAATISAAAGWSSVNSISQPGTVSYSGPGANSSASVDFGRLSSAASANCGLGGDCSAFASASFTDAITIFGTDGILSLNPGLFSSVNYDVQHATVRFSFGSSSVVGAFVGTQFVGQACAQSAQGCPLPF